MTKQHTTLTIDSEMLELAKARGINLSRLLQDTLRAELLLSERDKKNITLQIDKLKVKLQRLEENHKEEVDKIESQIRLYEDKIKRLSNEESRFNSSEFDEVKEKFKRVCKSVDFNLTPLNLKTWRGIFKRDAKVSLTDSELINMLDEFREQD